MSGPFTIDDVRRAAERIAPHVVRTPVLTSPSLDGQAESRLFVKAEPLQVTGSFKVRGALNLVLGMSESQRAGGVVAYSTGNHAAATAAAARLAGCHAVVIVPSTTPAAKVENCRAWGAEVQLYDPATEDRVAMAEAVAAARGARIVPPFDHPAIMAGAGTAGLELADDLRVRRIVPDVVVVSSSGGGLASGVFTAMRDAFPDVELVVVEPRGHDKLAQSLAAGEVVPRVGAADTILDAIAGPTVGAHPLAVLSSLRVRSTTVTDEQTLRAMASAHQHLKIVAEPGGAAGLAAALGADPALRGRTVAVVASGGNVDPALVRRALD